MISFIISMFVFLAGVGLMLLSFKLGKIKGAYDYHQFLKRKGVIVLRKENEE